MSSSYEISERAIGGRKKDVAEAGAGVLLYYTDRQGGFPPFTSTRMWLKR
jgi:hypothetical protein